MRLPPVSSLSNLAAPLQAWSAYYTIARFFGSGGVKVVPASELAGYKPLGQFARAAYCLNSRPTWTCGDACDANPDFQLSLTGIKRFFVHDYFVGFSPSLNSIIVSHEGTDPSQFTEYLTESFVILGRLNGILFPGIAPEVKVHSGFRNEHANTALDIFNEVKRLIVDKNTKNITVVGHSLGGAIAELSALSLTLTLPSDVNIRAVVFGAPRVGNPAYAELFDSKVPNFKRINNMQDIIPILPGRFLGYLHPQGEIHLLAPGSAVSCPGNDDAIDPQCHIRTVPNILVGNSLHHSGPYEGVRMGTTAC